MKLEEMLKRDFNNFDLIRLIAAIMVIYGHSFTLIKNAVGTDLLHEFTGVYSGEFGLKTFFFLSGLLVTNSVLSSKTSIQYIMHRFFRIWPALAFVVLSTAFIIGPLCSSLTFHEYFTSSETWLYVRNILTFHIWGFNSAGLPGVFVDNHYKNVVNAPIWTLGVEVFAYILILALYLVGGFNKKVALFIFIIFMLDTFLPERIIFFWLPKDSFDFTAIPFCFAIGAIMAIYKSEISINMSVPIGFLLLCYLFRNWVNETYLIYTLIFMSVLYVGSLSLVVNMPKFPDISYGTYLWGWPVTQVAVHFFPDANYFSMLIATLIITLIMGYFSWLLVERRAMRFSKNVIKNFAIV